jgi:hypothetical protein
MKGALLLVAASLGAVGCQNNDLSLAIVSMQAVTKPSCMAVAGTAAGVGRDRGLLDVSLVTNTGYVGIPVVRNQMMSRIIGTGTELNSIEVLGANVTLKLPSGAAAPLPSAQQKFFYDAAAGRIDPNNSAPMFIEVLPAAAAIALTSKIPAGGLFTVLAEIKPVGMRANDQIIGGPIHFPIDLCQNCLLINAGTCPLPKGTVPAVGGCFPQQDEPATCCSQGGALLCGSAAPIAAM